MCFAFDVENAPIIFSKENQLLTDTLLSEGSFRLREGPVNYSSFLSAQEVEGKQKATILRSSASIS